MADSDSSPKRRYPRLGTQKLVTVTQIDEKANKQSSTTRSIGPGGLSLDLPEAPSLGTLLGLHFPVGDELLKVEGRVAYTRALPADGYEVGIEFTEIDAEARRNLIGLLEKQAVVEASLFATSLAVEINRCIEDRRAEEPKIDHKDCLAALELVRLRLEQRASTERRDVRPPAGPPEDAPSHWPG